MRTETQIITERAEAFKIDGSFYDNPFIINGMEWKPAELLEVLCSPYGLFKDIEFEKGAGRLTLKVIQDGENSSWAIHLYDTKDSPSWFVIRWENICHRMHISANVGGEYSEAVFSRDMVPVCGLPVAIIDTLNRCFERKAQ